MCACVHALHACIHECMYYSVSACLHVCMSACMHACMYVCMLVCMYIVTCICLDSCIEHLVSDIEQPVQYEWHIHIGSIYNPVSHIEPTPSFTQITFLRLYK